MAIIKFKPTSGGEDFELLSLISPRLLKLDYDDSATIKLIIFSSFFFFASVYMFSMIVSSVLPVYRRLRTKEKVFWNLTIVRSVFGVFASMVGFWTLFNETAMDRDVVFGTTATSHFAIISAIGFFIFECLTLLASDILYGNVNILLNLHHLVALGSLTITITSRSGHLFTCTGLVLEMSTPFSAVCWIMLKCGKEKSLVWKANQFLLVHTFHCRSVVEFYFWLVTYKNSTYIFSQMPSVAFGMAYLQIILLTFVLTPYWTYKKTWQLFEQKDWNFADNQSVVSEKVINKCV